MNRDTDTERDMTSSPVRYETKGAVAVITIDRPEALNALNRETIAALEDAFDAVAKSPDARVAVLTGTGRAFVAGGDISDLKNRTGLPHYLEFAEDIHRLFRRIETLDKPTIAAINGFALGGGTELLLSMDLRFASDRAKFGLPEINLGLFPGAGGSQRIVRQLPACIAKELLFTGDMISAEEAHRIGLINRVVAADALMDETLRLAERIASKSPLTLKLLKRVLLDGGEMPLGASLRHEQAMIGLVLDSQDAHEGTAAFLEKRAPAFAGK